LNAWDVGEVTNINMTWMFYGASSFNQDLNAWDVSKVSCFQGDSGEVTYSGAWIYGIWNV
jgi:surface protein